MFLLACSWWYRVREIEPVIAAIGFLVSFAQTFPPPADAGELKRRDLEIRQKLRQAYPRSKVHWELALRRPTEKWESARLIIHALSDDTYPGGNQALVRGVYSWFGSELYDFYHNGMLVFRNIVGVVLTSDGQWAVVDHRHEDLDLEPYEQAKAYHLGCIPFRDIAEVDPNGDEFYPSPHIFCRFAENGTPYEDEKFILVGAERDEPLFAINRFELQS